MKSRPKTWQNSRRTLSAFGTYSVNPRLVHRGTHYPDIEHTMPFSHACQGATTSHRPVRSRRDHIEGHGEYDIDEYQQSANEPCRTTAIRNEGRRHGSDHHHRHRTRPKLQVHWFGPDDVAQEHKHRCNEQGDLGSTSERYADAHI